MADICKLAALSDRFRHKSAGYELAHDACNMGDSGRFDMALRFLYNYKYIERTVFNPCIHACHERNGGIQEYNVYAAVDGFGRDGRNCDAVFIYGCVLFGEPLCIPHTHHAL